MQPRTVTRISWCIVVSGMIDTAPLLLVWVMVDSSGDVIQWTVSPNVSSIICLCQPLHRVTGDPFEILCHIRDNMSLASRLFCSFRSSDNKPSLTKYIFFALYEAGNNRFVQGGNLFVKKTYYGIAYLYITPCLTKLMVETILMCITVIKIFRNLVNVVCLDYKYYSQRSSYLKVQYIFILFFNETIIVIE